MIPLNSCGRLSTLVAVVFVIILPLCAAAQSGDADAGPQVTPYRPTVSNPADLSAPGWLEAEFGGLHVAAEDHSRDDTVPWLMKYAFDENYGLLIGGNAYARAQVPGEPSQSGAGDTMIEWKQRFPLSDSTAFGIEAGTIIPTAAHALGVGKPEWLANAIFSTNFSALHLDLNLAEAHANGHDPGVSPWQTTWAAAVSWPLSADWGGALELSGTHQRGLATQSQVLAAINYNASRRLSLDAGVSYGLTEAAHDRGLFAGATVLIGRVR